MDPTDDRPHIVAGYRRVAEIEAAPVSPLYAGLADAVAGDDAVLDFLVPLPVGKRQPNLLFAAIQYLHGTASGADGLRRAVLHDGDRLRATMLTRATQTNEAARCAALLPLLAQPDG